MSSKDASHDGAQQSVPPLFQELARMGERWTGKAVEAMHRELKQEAWSAVAVGAALRRFQEQLHRAMQNEDGGGEGGDDA